MRGSSITPASRLRLAALHRRFAGRLRTAARWLGIADAGRDEAVAACFRGLAGDVPEDMTAGWAALVRRLAAAAPPGSHWRPLGPEEAALLGFLRGRAPAEQAAFALAELGGFDAGQLARAIGAPEVAGQALIVGLRRAFAGDPAVIAAGGPAAVLRACVDDDRPPAGWREAGWADLESMFPRSGLSGQKAAVVGVGALLVAALLALRPPPREPRAPEGARPAPVVIKPVRAVAEPEPPPPPVAPPPLLPVPADTVKKPGAERKLVVRKRPPARPRATELAERAEQAAARDPGMVIVELEMLGAARKALAGQPGQALAYVDQHAREFPGSQLVEHRAELRVRALCALGRAAEARAEAQRRPAAKVQAALREACPAGP